MLEFTKSAVFSFIIVGNQTKMRNSGGVNFIKTKTSLVRLLIEVRIKLQDHMINRCLAMRQVLPRKFFEKYRISGNISNFKIYIIWISVYSKTDFFF